MRGEAFVALYHSGEVLECDQLCGVGVDFEFEAEEMRNG